MKPFVIGIAGGTGSGKTTVARRIYESLHLDSAVFLDQDSYYKDLGHLSLEERRRVNFDHPDSLDDDLLVEQLRCLLERRAIDKPTYDFAAYNRAAATVRIEPRDVVLVEGILLFVEPRLPVAQHLPQPLVQLAGRTRHPGRAHGGPAACGAAVGRLQRAQPARQRLGPLHLGAPGPAQPVAPAEL